MLTVDMQKQHQALLILHFVWQGISLEDEQRSNVAVTMDVDQLDVSDCRNCFILFHKFVKEVSVMKKDKASMRRLYLNVMLRESWFCFVKVVVRMKQYKDDLLASCLQLVLSLPNELVRCDMDVIIPVLKVERTIPNENMCTIE